MKRKLGCALGGALLLLVGGAMPAGAAELRVGTQNIPVLDPHFMLQDSNIAYNQHIFGALLDTDQRGAMKPDLAERWEAVGDAASGWAWRFHLRRGVVFHDGSPFTADDVVFSLQRVPAVPNNPAPYSGQLLGVTGVKKVDEFTVDVLTDGYLPLLPPQIAKLGIVSRRAAEGRGTEEFNAGRIAVGTGPYKVAGVQGRERLHLERFEGYWGPKPDWEKVEFRVLPNDATRVAALLAGDVDLIEFVPLGDAAKLGATPGITVHSGNSARVTYLGLNLDPRPSPADGKNPLTEPKVRQAISLAINRDGIVRSTLQGFGRVATQVGVPGMTGYLDELKADALDMAAAKRLLAEAGYPEGFATSLLCTNGRYIADAQVCQALGQMLARVGVRTAVEAVPASVFFSRVKVGNNPAPLFLGAWSNVMGDAGYTLNNLYHSVDTARKMGSVNRSGLADAALDREIDAALTEHDPARRLELLRSAERRATDSRVLLPIFTAPVVLASRNTITYDVGDSGSSEMTSAMRAHPR